MKYHHERSNFARRVVNSGVYPQWDHSVTIKGPQSALRTTTGTDTAYLYTPVTGEKTKNVQGVLITRVVGQDTMYKYLFADDYLHYPASASENSSSATDVALLFFYFENLIFDHQSMKIKDYKRLFFHSYSDRTLQYTSQVNMARQRCQSTTTDFIQVCTTVNQEDDFDQYQYDTDVIPSGGGSGSYVVCKTYMIVNSVDYDCGGSGGFSSGWAGGSGGTNNPPPGGLPTPSDPYPFQNDPDKTFHGPKSPATNFGGWQPLVIAEEEPTYSPENIIDSLNGYPCAQSVLAALPNINNLSKTILANTFGINENLNVIFRADSTMPNNEDGSTARIIKDGNKYNVKVRLNTNMLKNSSKEYILNIMLHESIHAYINYQWMKYVSNQIDSNTFKTQFPIIWDYRMRGNSQHMQMAQTYVNGMKQTIVDFNTNVNLDMARAISWKGLHSTPAWLALGNDTLDIRVKQAIAKYGNANQMNNFNLHKCN